MSKQRPANQRDQVQKILDTLHRHSDVVSLSLAGRISNIDDSIGTSVAALTGIGALMPMGEGSYQLNPRIRRFLHERLSHFSALQALTRISEQLESGRAQWRELTELQANGDATGRADIEEALTYTIGEIVYFMRQNLRVLNHQTATNFGDVQSMKRKLRQNRFYDRNVIELIRELDQLEAFLLMVETEALQYNLFEIRNLLVSQVKSQIGGWRYQLNEIQLLITDLRFELRRIEKDWRLLFDACLWLENNPTLNGIDMEAGDSPSPCLLPITPIKVRSHFDTWRVNESSDEILRSVASRLPLERVAKPKKEPRARQVVISTDVEYIEPEIRPEDQLIQELIHELRTGGKAFELRSWQEARRKAAGIGDEEWLLYAMTQLAIAEIPTELQFTTANDTCNAVFDDIMAIPV